MERNLTGIVGIMLPPLHRGEMLTHALDAVGKAIIGGQPHAAVETDTMKLIARSDVELDIAVGSAALFLAGIVVIFTIGLLSEAVWHSKLGADAGGALCAIGILGYMLHYARARVLKRRADRLDRGEAMPDPLNETFWTHSSDRDLIPQLAIGVVVLIITYVS